MAISPHLLKRPSDRNLFLGAAVAFPLLVLLGYFKSYYFSAFFADVRPVANALVHAHGIVMTVWVLYFTAQIALIRSKNMRLHQSLGYAGIALAALVVVVGMAAAVDALLVRPQAGGSINLHGFFLVATVDMILFVTFFAGAIYYRRNPERHKSLMLMTAVNFLPPAIARLPFVPPQHVVLWAFGASNLLALVFLGLDGWKHRRLNTTFLAALLLFFVSMPLRLYVAETRLWLDFAGWLASGIR